MASIKCGRREGKFMNRMNMWRRLYQEEKGATATEYAIVIVLILLVVLATVVVLGQQITSLFDEFGSIVAPFFSRGP
jgi:pilus assembly protein Flp/PilA